MTIPAVSKESLKALKNVAPKPVKKPAKAPAPKKTKAPVVIQEEALIKDDAPIKVKKQKRVTTPAADLAEERAAPVTPTKEPFCYVDEHRHTFLVVQREGTEIAMLTMRKGEGIDVEFHNIESEFFLGLVPCSQQRSIQDAARPLIMSKLPKTPVANQVLDAIVFAKNADQTDFLTGTMPSDRMPTGTKKSKNAKKASTKPQRDPNLVSLADLCQTLTLDPKAARVALRKHRTKPAEGWCWHVDELAEVKANLKKWVK